MKRGRLDEAEELFRKALSLRPGHLPSLQFYAQLHIERKNDEAARELLQRALQINPRHLPSIHILAGLELRLENIPEAMELLKAILDMDPGNVPAITSMGRFYWLRGDREKARAVFASIEELRSDEEVSKVLCCWSDLERHAGNIELAREKLNLSLTHNPRHISSLTSLASLEARAGRFDEALRYYESGLAVDKYNAYLCNNVVHLLRQLGKREEAKQLLVNLLRKRPTINVSWHILGQMYIEEGELQEARRCFEKGLKINSNPRLFPSEARSVITEVRGALLCIEGLAELELFLGNAAKARELYVLGDSTYRPTSRYYRMWANFEKKQGNNEVARKLFEKSYDRNPQDTKTLLQWGLHERRCGNDNKAESCFLEGLKWSSQNPFLWYSYARMLVLGGHIDKARQIFKNAIANCPKDGPLIMEYGIMEWDQGNVKDARRLFESGMPREDFKVHLPLVEAWLQMETELGNQEAVAELEGQLRVLRATKSTSAKSRAQERQALKLLEKF